MAPRRAQDRNVPDWNMIERFTLMARALVPAFRGARPRLICAGNTGGEQLVPAAIATIIGEKTAWRQTGPTA